MLLVHSCGCIIVLLVPTRVGAHECHSRLCCLLQVYSFVRGLVEKVVIPVDAATWVELAAVFGAVITFIWLAFAAWAAFQRTVASTAEVRQEIKEVRQEIKEIRQEIKEEMRRHVAAVRKDIRGIERRLTTKLDSLFVSNVVDRVQQMESRVPAGGTKAWLVWVMRLTSGQLQG